MVINHNLLALNSVRQSTIVNKSHSKTMRKLSSGYRINQASDDAAGLAISEKMRRQIRGLSQGIANSEDGISLCQVADGALNEVTDMIHRMSELSVQAANGTNSQSDREYIQMEVSQLLQEIDRIGETTKFNEIYIFKGEETHIPPAGTASGGSSAGKSFFDIMGANATQSGYMSEGLTEADVTDFTNQIDASAPHPSAHIDFGGLSDLKELMGTSFEIGCCTGDCNVKISFVDETDISVDIDTSGDPVYGDVKIGLKKTDGSYYNNASEFCKYIFDKMDSIEQNPWYINIKFAYNGSTLYLYDENNGPYDPNQCRQLKPTSPIFSITNLHVYKTHSLFHDVLPTS